MRGMTMAKRTIKNEGYLSVPYSFIDTHLAAANGTFVKIYLYALRHSGRELTDEAIAEALGILESDVLKAWKYWEKQGVISLEGGAVDFSPAPSAPADALPAKKEAPAGRKKYTEKEMAQAMETNPELKVLYSFAQQKLGNIISPADVNILFSLYDWLKLPVEVIVMLFEYCAEKGKLNMRYIESTAVHWVERGMLTAEQVEEFCRQEEQQKQQYAEFQKMAGITGRKLSQTEKKYIDTWTIQMHFSFDMLRLAYDQTVMNTGKLSMPYMNKILTSWNREGITTPQAAEQAREQYRSSKGEGVPVRKPVQNQFNRYSAPGGENEDEKLLQQLRDRQLRERQQREQNR